MARRRLGQHFLTHPIWQRRVLQALPLAHPQVWLEIGAGRGAFTGELAQRVGRVVAVEVDARLAAALEKATAHLPVEVVHADILTVELEKLLPARFHVFGSLPYYITSPILRRLSSYVEQIEEMFVIVQWEVAQRLVAAPGSRSYGYLSAFTQFYTRPKILFRIPPSAFRPRPAVHSALVRLTPPGLGSHRPFADPRAFLRFLEQAFAHKRKTLLNNLRAYFPLARLTAALQSFPASLQVRAEQLSLEQLADLFERLTGPSSIGSIGCEQPAPHDLEQRPRQLPP